MNIEGEIQARAVVSGPNESMLALLLSYRGRSLSVRTLGTPAGLLKYVAHLHGGLGSPSLKVFS